MRTLTLSVLVLQVCALSLQARTPAQIKTVLESICPQDTFIKAAYLKDGTPANFAEHTNNATVYVVSSEDGVVRKVNTISGSLTMVNITADGKRVLYWDKNTSRTYVVNWDGTGERVVTSSGMLLEYWRDKSAGTDWAIIGNGGQSRVNIDKTTEKVQLSQYECGGLGSGLSDDGTRIIVYNNGWGSAAVGSSTIQKGSGGCQASMRPGPVAQWSCNESGHGNSIINNPNGTVAFKIRMGTSSTTGEGARFTQHPNFFTFMESTSPNGIALPRPTNPVILRVSDSTRIGIEDNIPNTMWCGDVDVVFLPKLTSVSRRSPRMSPASLRTAGLRADAFTVAGRRLSGNAAATGSTRGVILIRGNDRSPALGRSLCID